jgi:hypothetical protein
MAAEAEAAGGQRPRAHVLTGHPRVKTVTMALALSEQGILHLAQVNPFGQKIGDGTLLAWY